MCTLAAYVQCSAAFPLVIAANRDELYARPATEPQQLADNPWVVGGRDLIAGGTWLGINAHGLAAGVLNRRSDQPPDPSRRSRGQLCLDVLAQATTEHAAALVQHHAADTHNPFNLLITSPQSAMVLGNGSGAIGCTPLPHGVHVLTNLDLNDMECPRLAKSYALFSAAAPVLETGDLPALLSCLRQILSDHSTPLDPRDPAPTNNVCMHGESFGTRSSSVLIYEAATRRWQFWHAGGPPCSTEYRQVPLPAGTVDVAPSAKLWTSRR